MTTEQAQKIISLLEEIGRLLVIIMIGKFINFAFFKE